MSRHTSRSSAGAPRPRRSPPSLTARLCVALLLLMLVQGTVWGVQKYAVPATPRPLRQELETLPRKLAAWSGADTESDPQLFEALGCAASLSRTYTRPDGTLVGIHCAAWLAPDTWLPHPPEMCYRGAGWTEERRESVTVPSDPPMTARLAQYEQQGQRVLVLHWYQMGDTPFVDRSGARAARRKLWGAERRPPLVKVLMQARDDGTEASRAALLELAAEIGGWTSQL